MHICCVFLCVWLYHKSPVHPCDLLGTSGINLKDSIHIDGLMQKGRNSSALAMELRLFCIKPSISTDNKPRRNTTRHEPCSYFLEYIVSKLL